MHRTKTWTVSTVLGLISDFGGIAVSLTTFLRVLFVHRTKHSFDINRLKRFFYIKRKNKMDDDSIIDNRNGKDGGADAAEEETLQQRLRDEVK